MTRPTLLELAKARAELQRFLAANPGHELVPVLHVMLRATAPLTKEEALPVMIKHANEAGGWSPRSLDKFRADDALASTNNQGSWHNSIRAQWATLQHFFGGAE